MNGTSTTAGYETIGDIHDANIILGYAGGAGWGHDSIAWQLADYAMLKAEEYELPIFANDIFARAYHRFGSDEHAVEWEIELPEHRLLGEAARTWDFLNAAKRVMTDESRRRPLLVVQHELLPVVTTQAEILNIHPVVAGALPGGADLHAEMTNPRRPHHRLMNFIGRQVMRHQHRI